MIAMRVVEVPVDEVIDVIAVWHRLMAATEAMDVALFVPSTGRGATIGVRVRDRDDMLIDVIAVRMVKMTVMQVVHMTFV